MGDTAAIHSSSSTSEGDASFARTGVDRRSRPTPMMSRYWLRGRRQGGRRSGETRNMYVDGYTREEGLLVILLVAAASADLGLTILHLAAGGAEANPVMDWFLAAGGIPAFAAAKILLTVGAALFLLIHARFRGTRPALWGLGAMYVAIMVYHVVAYIDRA